MAAEGPAVTVRDARADDLPSVVAFNALLASETEGKTLDLATLRLRSIGPHSKVSFDRRPQSASRSRAAPRSIASAAMRTPSAGDSARPATQSEAAAFARTMSRTGPRSPSKRERRREALSAGP